GPPARRVRVGPRDLAPHLVGGQRDEVVLAAHVPVDRGGGRPEALAQGAHVQALEPFGGEQVNGRADDLFAGQRVARHVPTIGHLVLDLHVVQVASRVWTCPAGGCGWAAGAGGGGGGRGGGRGGGGGGGGGGSGVGRSRGPRRR